MSLKIDSSVGSELESVGYVARECEGRGHHCLWSSEINHDPFLPLVLAARETSSINLGTGVAIAFARTPMTIAYQAFDLHAFSHGRLILGLGSQVRAHIERRFGMEWSHPVPRMREFVAALHAIWSAWQNDDALKFEGDFYAHTLMPPIFCPPPNSYGVPKVFLAGVGERMTELAGEVADGFLCHAFTTERYMREVTVPALERGLARSGRARADFEISGPGFLVTGRDESEMARMLDSVRQRIAFYGSTPGYEPVLAHHGWGELHRELRGLARQQRWDQMGQLIDDDIVGAFAIVADPQDVATRTEERYGDIVDRMHFFNAVPDETGAYEAAVASFQIVNGG
jgi:probable F420-dependent oxidoreductase